MKKEIFVVKRNGSKEPYQIEKIQKQIEYACSGIDFVSQSMIELNMNLEVFDGITTKTIDQLAINAAANLINPETEGGHTNYQYVAGRLQNSVLRKQVYGQFEPWHITKVIERGIKEGLYTPELNDLFQPEQWDILNSSIDHSKDENLSYSAIKQFIDKYQVRNRATKGIIDTPQIRYMICAAVTFPGDVSKAILYYKHISNGEFTLPTPQIAGLGTPTKQFSSCVLLKSDDTMDSIFATGEMVAKYSAKRAGIGLDVGRLRPEGSAIRGGEVLHTGLTPFLKKFYGDLRCASQGGIRNSSATVNYPWWHAELETLIVLKNNRGTDETRVRHMDYAVALNRLLVRRAKAQENVSLFNPNEVPALYEAFYRNVGDFERLYEKFENDPNVSKRVLPAADVLNAIATERSDTGRIYLLFVDNVIEHVPFDTEVDPVYQTNLCAEVLLPTQPFQRLEDAGEITLQVGSETLIFENSVQFMDSDGKIGSLRNIKPDQKIERIFHKNFPGGILETSTEDVKVVDQTRPAIALCTLASMNWGKFKKPEQMRAACRAVVEGLDNLLSYQDYLSVQSMLGVKDFRPLGVGVTNLAYWHAKRGFKYGEPEALKELARWMEHQSYYLIEASIDLAAERGHCDRYDFTHWAKGIFPHERSPETLNEIREWSPELDWEKLREKLKKHGIRNATLGAIAPVESSSVVIDSTNGIEIPKNLVSVKDSRGSVLVQVVPEYNKLKGKYQTMWELDDCEGYLKTAATMAQFIDQSISTNTFYDPSKFEGGKIPRTLFLKNIVNSMRWGLRTLYYNITKKTGFKGELEASNQIENIQSIVVEDEPCEACVL